MINSTEEYSIFKKWIPNTWNLLQFLKLFFKWTVFPICDFF